MSRLHFLKYPPKPLQPTERRSQRQEVAPLLWVALILAGILLLGLIDATEPQTVHAVTGQGASR